MTTNLHHLHAAIRCLSVLVSFSILSDFVSPAMWVLSEPLSVLSRIAQHSYSPTGLAICWLLAAGMVMPFVVMQIFWPDYVYRRRVIKAANYGLIAGACIWGFLAFLSRNLDYGFAVWNFIFNSLVAIAMAALMANSLNNDQKETSLNRGPAGAIKKRINELLATLRKNERSES